MVPFYAEIVGSKCTNPLFYIFRHKTLWFPGNSAIIQAGDNMNQDFVVTGIARVILVGKYEYQEKITDFSKNPLRHNELILHLSGKATVRFNGLTFWCEKDNIRFLPKGEKREYIVDREEHGECIVIYFDTNAPVSEEAFVLKPQNHTVVTNLFKKLFSVWVSKCEGYYWECLSLLYKILAEIQKENYIPENQYKAIKPAMEYIHEHFLHGKIVIADLADLCRISESYLKKLFHKKFGVPPTRYIIQRKIHYACDLLQAERYTITQVAEACGYSNVYFFSRQFKEYMGVSPTIFMEKYKSSK